MSPEIRSIIDRSQSLSVERQQLFDRLWQLEKESQDLQRAFFELAGTEEVEVSFKMEGQNPKVTGIRYKKGKNKK